MTVAQVVPHAGDVDRKKADGHTVHDYEKSSPTRGTWIERLFEPLVSMPNWIVVPHAGDVDRKEAAEKDAKRAALSSPTRGTWIERPRALHCPLRHRSSPTRGTWIESAIPTHMP